MSLSDRIRAIVEPLPPGASVILPADTLRAWLNEEPVAAPAIVPIAEPESWRTRLWSCPDSARLGVRELCEALDRGRDWVYRAVSREHAAEHGRNPLPARKLDGVLTFEAGAVRRWLEASERVINPEPRPRLRAS